MSTSIDVQLYKLKQQQTNLNNFNMAATYGLLYQIYINIYFQLAAIGETVANSINFLGIYRRRRAKMPENLQGKTVMITGANSGIGKECAIACAIRGAQIILACRDQTKALEAVEQIVATVGKERRDQLFLVELDLSSLDSVRKCAQQVENRFERIDVLINNAGVMMCPQWNTKDGYEYQLATNHLGHFLLTNLLMEKIKSAPSARIVNLSSIAHMPGQMYFDNFDMDGIYTPFKSYARSKLANIFFTRELAKRLKNTNITVYSAHPGMVNTELKRHLNKIQQFFLKWLNKMILISPELGAQTSLYCAFDERVSNQTGHYYANCSRVEKLFPHVTDDSDSAKLWELSLKMCNIENNNFI